MRGSSPAPLPPERTKNMAKTFNRQIVHKGSMVLNQKNQNVNYQAILVETNGTTAVDVFGTGGAPANLTVKAVTSVALDTTAGNITPKNAGSTICTIAKGTTTGLTIRGTSLANTAIKEGASVTVVSSSAGNSLVTIWFTYDPE